MCVVHCLWIVDRTNIWSTSYVAVHNRASAYGCAVCAIAETSRARAVAVARAKRTRYTHYWRWVGCSRTFSAVADTHKLAGSIPRKWNIKCNMCIRGDGWWCCVSNVIWRKVGIAIVYRVCVCATLYAALCISSATCRSYHSHMPCILRL